MKLPNALLLLALSAPLCTSLPQATPQNPLPRASSGCGQPHWPTDFTHYRFGLPSSNHSRSYSYHLPADYDPSRAYPLVVGFHGSSSVGLFFELDTKLSQARYSADKIIVYPNGLDGSWAGPTYHTASTVAEDIQFVADLLADVKARVCVDESRVFAVGMSNGGGFVGTLACDARGSTLFGGYAAHSGAFYTDVDGPENGCAPARPVPVLEIHGGKDATVRYEGGEGDGGVEPPIGEWVGWWAERNGCGGRTVERLFGGEVERWEWECGGRKGGVTHYRVEGMGHCWADTEINLSQVAVPQGPTVMRASEVIMKWFDGLG